MWCVAPRWPAHGRHLAVEFVHPVIVGKRALAAVFVEGDDLVGQMRLVARPGDIVATIGEIDDPLRDLLRRAEPWGLTSVWHRCRPPAPGRSRRPRPLGRRRRRGHVDARRGRRARLSPAVGADPCRVRASRPAPRRGGMHRRRVHHVLRRGPAGGGDARPHRRSGRRRHRWRASCRRRQPDRAGAGQAISCSFTPAWRSPCCPEEAS